MNRMHCSSSRCSLRISLASSCGRSRCDECQSSCDVISLCGYTQSDIVERPSPLVRTHATGGTWPSVSLPPLLHKHAHSLAEEAAGGRHSHPASLGCDQTLAQARAGCMLHTTRREVSRGGPAYLAQQRRLLWLVLLVLLLAVALRPLQYSHESYSQHMHWCTGHPSVQSGSLTRT